MSADAKNRNKNSAATLAELVEYINGWVQQQEQENQALASRISKLEGWAHCHHPEEESTAVEAPNEPVDAEIRIAHGITGTTASPP